MDIQEDAILYHRGFDILLYNATVKTDFSFLKNLDKLLFKLGVLGFAYFKQRDFLHKTRTEKLFNFLLHFSIFYSLLKFFLETGQKKKKNRHELITDRGIIPNYNLIFSSSIKLPSPVVNQSPTGFEGSIRCP